MFSISKIQEVIKEMYYFELEQKEKINNRITVPLAVLTLLLGLAVYQFKNLSDINMGILGWIFLIFYTIYLLCILLSIIMLFRAYYNYEYSYIPSPKNIENDINSIKRYYDDNYERFYSDKGSKEELVDQEIDKFLYKYYLNATEKNIPMNERKFKLLSGIGKVLLIAILFAGLSIIPYQLSYKEDKIVEIKIIENKDLKLNYQKENNK